MIKWEKEHHLNLEERKRTSFAGDVEGMLSMQERAIAQHVDMEEAKGFETITGKNE